MDSLVLGGAEATAKVDGMVADSPITLDAKEQAKAEKMLKKTEDFRILFNLPAIDFVIQDYHCGFWRGLPHGWWQGRMLITTNHVLFRASVGSFALDIKLRELVSIADVRSLLVVNNGLDIFTKSEKLCFGTFVTPGHRDEALVIIRHLLLHPVTFLTADDLDGEKVDEELHRSSSSAAKKSIGPLKLKTAPILHKFDNDSLRFAKLQVSEFGKLYSFSFLCCFKFWFLSVFRSIVQCS